MSTPGPGLPTEFAEEVMDLVAQIPAGRVLTYGDVAALVGRGGARAVGTVMSRFGAGLPWWRVLRAGGIPPQCHEGRALAAYEAEGTPLVHGPGGYHVDLEQARWEGPEAVGPA